MDNRDFEPYDQKFLAPLKERPGLEPDERFVERLRTEITMKNSSSQRLFKWRWPVIVPMSLAVLVFALLTLSLMDQSTDKKNSEKKEVPVTDNSQERDIYQLIAENEAFSDLYRGTSKEVGSPVAGRELVYYFDAIAKRDTTYLAKLMGDSNPENTVASLLHYYQTADFTTLKAESLTRESDTAPYQLVFTYFDQGKSETIRRRLMIDVQEKTKISDSVVPLDWNSEKDREIKEKAEEIEKEMTLGLSMDEAENLYGKDYKVIKNTEKKGIKEEWLFQFLEEGTNKDAFFKDTANLQNQKIGIQLLIGWSSENKAVNFIELFGQEGQVFGVYLNEDGKKRHQETRFGEIKYLAEPFMLNETERELYDRFKQNHDEAILKGVRPLIIAKLYVNANLEHDTETEYALYTTRPDHVRWTKEEHLEYAKQDSSTKEEILNGLGGIQNGTFVETGDLEGYIQFESKMGPSGFFRMIKDPNGIWKVAFMPIQ